MRAPCRTARTNKDTNNGIQVSVLNRSRLLTEQLEEMQRERFASIVEPSRAGYFINKIGGNAGLSRSRVYQLLQEHAGRPAAMP
jgi:hypothetical protein